MNVRRFVGRNAREAIAQARGAWGDQAVVLSNRPIPGGVEILAMESAEAPMHSNRAKTAQPAPKGTAAAVEAKRPAGSVEPMSTLSFQQFVRERQRLDAQGAEAKAEPVAEAVAAPAAAVATKATPARRKPPVEPGRFAAEQLNDEVAQQAQSETGTPASPAFQAGASAFAAVAQAGQGEEMLAELKSMRGMISSQLASLSWFDTVRRNPAQTQLLRLMISNGFSPALARQLVHRLPDGRDEAQSGQWLLDVLAKNLHCADSESIANKGGVFALVGPTGAGKTTTTAKIAANFAMQHGAASVGLITVDTYRMGASDQLGAFGKILNIPVHMARDSAALVDLLNLFEKKKLVLIDTVGVGQRDRRLTDLFAALPAERINRLLVLNASAQAETLEEVVQAYGTGAGGRCVISKLDEAVKCGGVIDVAIRHQLLVEGFANGQRVPEDWHAARAKLLVQKALLRQPNSIFTPDDTELGLMLTAPPAAGRVAGGMRA
ncbi:flagellar biosynthesis protein FlhF [uncultured Ramlibacter sp.]|uniref:flagellar biosynthesis protein FlhF n=1 Tax=uncultured Ramlibacter sp. TaxID=260755 RepID=UPI0026284225|nr:flagellar biosynthesis protein FlhF [uncultured Ramlibacter sp.]